MTNERPTVDAEHRDLASGRGDGLAHTYLVEAGAGTGKTTVLVDRLLALIRAGTAIPRIVAITFTEKAAGELKVRLREKLERAARDSEKAVTAGDDSMVSEAVTLAEALHQIDRASVSTIHGFCSTLLKERPVEAGVDPNFGVVDEFLRGVILDTVWDTWLREQFADNLPSCVADAEALGHGLTRIHELALELVEQRDLLDMVPDAVAPGDVDALADRLVEEAAAFEELARTKCTNPDDKALPEIEEFAGQVRLIEHVPEPARAAYVLRHVVPRPTSKGAKPNWEDDAITEIKDRAKALKEEQAALRTRLSHNAAVDLVSWLRGFVDAYEAEKSRLGLLDFEDLLVKARDLVRDNLEVREDFKRAFDHVLLDEFQDTDPLQCELAFFLCEVEGGRAKMWTKVQLEPGKLFLVGDPKQSIYRFRRADIETYEQARGIIARSGDVLELVENFRTRPEIVDSVNLAFERVMQRPEEGRYQPDYAALSAYRERAEVGPGVVVLPPASDLGEMGADEVREAEARQVAAFITHARETGAMKVYDRATMRWRPVELKDVAVLFHRTSALDAYEEAFSGRLEYRVAGGKKFYVRREVKELATVLGAIEDPHDLASVVGALRTPFFGASDEDILLHRHRAGTLSYVSNESSGIESVDDAMALLRDLHHERSELGAPRLIRELFDRTNALELFLMKPGGEQRHANLIKVAEIADQLTRDGAVSFGGFVRWLAEVQQLTPSESESPMSEEGDDFVRMLTIHKAKGLEFPVVVLADLAHYKAQDDSMIVDRERGRLEFGLGPKESRLATSDYEAFREREALRRDAELIRLLYVGTTRARDALVVPWFSGGKRAGPGLLNRLDAMRESATETVESLAAAEKLPGPVSFDAIGLDHDRRRPQPTRLKIEEAAQVDPAGTTAALERAEWAEWLAAFPEKHHRPAVIAAPSAAAGEDVPGFPHTKPGAPELPPGVTGADVGTVVHEAMERLDLAARDLDHANIVAVCRAVAVSRGLPSSVAEDAAGIVRTGLGSEVIERVRTASGAGRRFWRELPFCIAREGGTIEGTMDLVFEEEDGLVVVDYKTNVLGSDPEESAGALSEHYRPQAEAYGAALSVVSDLPVKEVVLLFMRGPVERPIPVEADPGSVEEALGKLVTEAA
jgi:ATP-dependent exoDNAse (exonuclease V) beta subunit